MVDGNNTEKFLSISLNGRSLLASLSSFLWIKKRLNLLMIVATGIGKN